MFESPWHWVVVAIVAFILFFGWKQLPDMARSVGRSLRVFKTEIKGLSEDEKARDEAKEAPRAVDPPRAEIVKNENATPTRPRPAPSPNGQSRTPTPGA